MTPAPSLKIIPLSLPSATDLLSNFQPLEWSLQFTITRRSTTAVRPKFGGDDNFFRQDARIHLCQVFSTVVQNTEVKLKTGRAKEDRWSPVKRYGASSRELRSESSTLGKTEPRWSPVEPGIARLKLVVSGCSAHVLCLVDG